jgi:hypothetical protein
MPGHCRLASFSTPVSVSVVMRIWRTAPHVVFIEDTFRNRIRWPVVPTRVVIVIETNGNDDPCANIGTAPSFFATLKNSAYCEFSVLHDGGVHLFL